jgi:hypothetical protein|uniref:Uncharacterized protein n=1 Tax=viral metagenome TaxID=1070528 RepID=A0A6C0IX17_9ZZZZ
MILSEPIKLPEIPISWPRLFTYFEKSKNHKDNIFAVIECIIVTDCSVSDAMKEMCSTSDVHLLLPN